MLKALFSIDDRVSFVLHNTATFSIKAKPGLECGIGFANENGEHKMIDVSVASVGKSKKDRKEIRIKCIVHEMNEEGWTVPKKTFTAELAEGESYEFNELE